MKQSLMKNKRKSVNRFKIKKLKNNLWIESMKNKLIIYNIKFNKKINQEKTYSKRTIFK